MLERHSLAGLDHTRPALSRDDLARLHVAYSMDRDPRVRDELVAAYSDLAVHLSNRFSPRLGGRDDLVQVAMIGLLGAIERYDPARGVQFTTFATATILGELKRHFRDRSWSLRPPRRIQEAYLATKASVSHLTQTLGRTPTIPEIAEDAGISEETVLEAMEAGTNFEVLSLDAPIGNDAEPTRSLQLGSAEPGYAAIETRELLSRLLQRLPERERRIVRLRFVENLTQAQIADQVGISQIHVSRLLSRSLATLRIWAGDAAAATAN